MTPVQGKTTKLITIKNHRRRLVINIGGQTKILGKTSILGESPPGFWGGEGRRGGSRGRGRRGSPNIISSYNVQEYD